MVPEKLLVLDASPIAVMKAIKNEVEVEGLSLLYPNISNWQMFLLDFFSLFFLLSVLRFTVAFLNFRFNKRPHKGRRSVVFVFRMVGERIG